MANRVHRKAESVGARVKRLRVRAGLSQVDLSAACGRARNWTSRLESGARNPDLADIVTLAAKLGVPASYLAFGELNVVTILCSRDANGLRPEAAFSDQAKADELAELMRAAENLDLERDRPVTEWVALTLPMDDADTQARLSADYLSETVPQPKEVNA